MYPNTVIWLHASGFSHRKGFSHFARQQAGQSHKWNHVEALAGTYRKTCLEIAAGYSHNDLFILYIDAFSIW